MNQNIVKANVLDLLLLIKDNRYFPFIKFLMHSGYVQNPIEQYKEIEKIHYKYQTVLGLSDEELDLLIEFYHDLAIESEKFPDYQLQILFSDAWRRYEETKHMLLMREIRRRS